MKHRMIMVACTCTLACGLLFAVGVSHAKVADVDMESAAMPADQIKAKAVFYSIAEIEKYLSELKTGSMDTQTEAVGSVDDGHTVSEETVQNRAAADDTALQDMSTDEANKDASTEDGESSETAEAKSKYADIAIAAVDNYVNVRTEPNTDSSIVGKIYDGAVAHVISLAGEENDWFQIVSGNVEGYTKAEFFLYGDAAFDVIDNYVTRYATVLADRLNVREEPDVESKRIGSVDKGKKVKILESLGEWLKVQYTDRSTGYVAAEYVTVSEEFFYAKSLEEEAKELAEKKALEERNRNLEAPATENTFDDVAPPDTSYSTNEELRQQIVDYAMQFLGNKYVHGGKTLAGGTDCSGFTSLIYQEFGYSLSRTPEGQRANAGRSVDYSNAQPGDILCYGSNGQCTHVAIYIGNGQMIHSSTPQSGVIIGNAEYTTIMDVKNIID